MCYGVGSRIRIVCDVTGVKNEVRLEWKRVHRFDKCLRARIRREWGVWQIIARAVMDVRVACVNKPQNGFWLRARRNFAVRIHRTCQLTIETDEIVFLAT